jgi:hypothetical protein
MSHKYLAIGTAAILFFSIALTALLTAYSVIETLNPIATLTAIAVAIIGLAWFKKTS